MLINKIQNDFCASILNQKNTAILEHICHNSILPEFRLNVYRNTILQNLRRALELTFPAIWTLVGKECADNLALTFIQKKTNLPTSHCLDDWGKQFPKFLRNTKPIAHLVYLQAIAQLDWLKHLSYCAADYRPLDPIILQNTLDNHLEKLRLRFNPSVFLYSSFYCLKDIFDLIDNPNKNKKIQLQLVSSYAVIARQNHHVRTHWVSKEIFEFFNQIKKRCTLMQSYEYMLNINPDFDLTAVLQFISKNALLQEGALTKK